MTNKTKCPVCKKISKGCCSIECQGIYNDIKKKKCDCPTLNPNLHLMNCKMNTGTKTFTGTLGDKIFPPMTNSKNTGTKTRLKLSKVTGTYFKKKSVKAAKYNVMIVTVNINGKSLWSRYLVQNGKVPKVAKDALQDMVNNLLSIKNRV